MSQQDILTLAKQGDPRAIATLLNRSTQPHGITVKAARQHQDLFLLIEATQVPEVASMVSLVRQAMVRLEVESIRTVKIFGRQTGNKTAIWNQDLKLPLLDESPDVVAIADTYSIESELVEHDAVETLDLESTSELDPPLSNPEVTSVADDRDEFEAALDAELNSPESSLLEPATDASDVVREAAIDEFEAALDAELDVPDSTLPEFATDESEATLDAAIDEFEAALEAVTDDADGALEPLLEPAAAPEPVAANPFEDALEVALAPEPSLPDVNQSLETDDFWGAAADLPDPDEPLPVVTDAIAPDETLATLDAPLEAVEPAISDLPEPESCEEISSPTEEPFPAPSLNLDAALETIGPDETAIYIEGPDPKPEAEVPANSPSEPPLATLEAESVAAETADYWTDSPDSSRSISVPEAITSWAEQRIAAVSVAEEPDHPSQAESALIAPVPESLAPNPSWEESEVQALLKKPEALAVLLVVLLVTLWDAYFQVLDEAEMTDGTLSGRALSCRLGTSASTVRRRREQADFSAWTQTLDPDGIAWIYREDGKFVPRL